MEKMYVNHPFSMEKNIPHRVQYFNLVAKAGAAAKVVSGLCLAAFAASFVI